MIEADNDHQAKVYFKMWQCLHSNQDHMKYVPLQIDHCPSFGSGQMVNVVLELIFMKTCSLLGH